MRALLGNEDNVEAEDTGLCIAAIKSKSSINVTNGMRFSVIKFLEINIFNYAI